ncbi:hypothetical protein AAEU28_11870 [Pseudoalteromonas sp. SS15]|uniref:alpha-glutamyl/putrescinyl thymine pyrophosphorylase clade 3 protein n=1 Tax=Pseudoalteromonas sp. SS15 TaxID=3139393 RepID=UPI003BA95322
MLLRSTQSEIRKKFHERLLSYNNDEENIRIIEAEDVRNTLVTQLIDSVRRVDYIEMLKNRPVSQERLDPISPMFDPLRAAIYHFNNDNIDEASWLIFLFTHFGKNPDTGYKLCADIYGAYGEREIWSWDTIIKGTSEFEDWYRACYPKMINDGEVRKFGNHRKYESLKPNARRSLAKVFSSYISWVGKSHMAKFSEAEFIAKESEITLFEYLYRSVQSVLSIGRTGAFDYLTMLAKVGIINASPDKLYLQGSTGPIQGAKLLYGENFTVNWNSQTFEEKLSLFGDVLELGRFKMQILEDALCNWQKSPARYKYFRG